MKKTIALLAFMVLGSLSTQAQNYGAPEGKVVPVADFYEGGKEAMYKFINSNINYPINAKRNRVQGEVVLSVNIGADGKATNQEIVKNVNGGCGEEALRVLKLMKFKGLGYSSRQNLSVYFRL